MTTQDTNDERRHWLGVLARASLADLDSAVRRFGVPAGERVRAPEVGMVMLRGRAGGAGDVFNLGEASVVRCAVRIGDALGVGYALGRERRKAELIARLDGSLQDPDRCAELRREVVAPLAAAQQERRDRQSRETASSRVDFFTLVRGES